jgi:hypothetical protein
MEKINLTSDEFLEVVGDAVMKASFKCDVQIVFDGETFHVEEIFCRDFIRGYVIKHNSSHISANDMDVFPEWITEQLTVHSNKCIKFYKDLGVKMNFNE